MDSYHGVAFAFVSGAVFVFAGLLLLFCWAPILVGARALTAQCGACLLLGAAVLVLSTDPGRANTPERYTAPQYAGFQLTGNEAALLEEVDHMGSGLRATIKRLTDKRAALTPSDTGDRGTAARVEGFEPLSRSMMDQVYIQWFAAQRETGAVTQAMWVPTTQCTPYGFVNIRGLAEADGRVPEHNGGFCQCTDGSFLGRPCVSLGSRYSTCAQVCGGWGNATSSYPTHRALAKAFPRRHDTAKPKGVVVTLTSKAREDDYAKTLVFFEAMFNKRYKYPYAALLQQGHHYPPSYSQRLRGLVSTELVFAMIEAATWDVPPFIDQGRVEASRDMQIARFLAVFFADHRALKGYDWYWRLPDDYRLLCPVHYDPFHLMQQQNKVFGFFSFHAEPPPSAASAEAAFQEIAAGEAERSWAAKLKTTDGQATACTFNTQMSIGSVPFFTSGPYAAYMSRIDRAGGMFYKSWSPSIIESLAMSFLVEDEQLYYFESIAYMTEGGRIHVPQDTEACTAHAVPEPGYIVENDNEGMCMKRMQDMAALEKAPEIGEGA